MGGKRRGGVLHPPRALLKTWECFDAALGQKAHASVGKHAAGHLDCPVLRIAFDRQIERRLDEIRGGDCLRPLRAVTRDPPVPKPVRRVDARRIETCDDKSPSLATRRSTALTSLS